MAPTTHDAATFVRERLRGHEPRVSHDELETLISDLKAMLGRALTATDVAQVIDTYRELTQQPG